MSLPKFVPRTNVNKLKDTIVEAYDQLERDAKSLPSLVDSIPNIFDLKKGDTTTGGSELHAKINNKVSEISASIREIQRMIHSMGGSPNIIVEDSGEYYWKTEYKAKTGT